MEVATNVTGVVISMVDNQYGVIQFSNRTNGQNEKAFFSAKALYRDGFQFSGDPTTLPRKI